MRHRWLGLLLMFVCMWYIGGCGVLRSALDGTHANPPFGERAETDDAKIILRFVYDGTDPIAKGAYSDTIKRFMTEYPKILIVQEPSGGGSYVDFLQTKDSIGEFPDMMEMRHTQWYAGAGRIAALPEALSGLVRNPAVINGRVYTLPLKGATPAGFLYNKEIFEYAGVRETPRNWEQFLSACSQIRRLDIAPLGVGGNGDFELLLHKIIMDNVLVDVPDWDEQRTLGKVSFTDDNFTQAMNRFKELFVSGCVNEDWYDRQERETVSLFVARKAAMIYSEPYVIDSIMEADTYFKMGFFVPGNDSGTVVLDSLQGQEGLALSAEAANDPAKAQAFADFVRFFYEPTNYQQYLKAGMLPSTIQEVPYPKPEVINELELLISSPHVSAYPLNELWGTYSVAPHFWDWFYAQTRQWIQTNSPSLQELLTMADVEWDRLSLNAK
jgi:raffinose/stachyose/melibiose transport system substrate-binding protein